jgi:hypothetical protein
MAAISGIANFYNASGPTSTDFNNTVKAILAQIGGQYYDEAQGKYVQSSGNLDSANISSTANFRNSQKSEQYSYFFLSSHGTTVVSTNTYVQHMDILPFAPVGVDYTIVGIGLAPGAAVAVYATTGSINVYGGNMLLANLDISQVGKNVLGRARITLDANIPIKAGDPVYIDYSNFKGYGSNGETSSTVSNLGNGLNAILTCKTLHVR